MNKMDEKYEALFTPWKIGDVEIKNRIVMCPRMRATLGVWLARSLCKTKAKLAIKRND